MSKRQDTSATRTDQSFGVIPVCLHEGERRYLIVQHGKGHWGFPKGHAENRETPVDAARRELEEETGLAVTQLFDDKPLVEEYHFTEHSRSVQKTVTYFIGRVDRQTVTPQPEEIADHAWGTLEQTMSRLTFEEGRTILEQAEALLAAQDGA